MAIIPVLTAASGLDIFLRNGAGQLTDPSSITYDIKEPGGTLVADDAVPFKRAVGVYDARTTIIPSGFSVDDPWCITWSWTSPGGVTSAKNEEFCVSTALFGSFIGASEIINQIKTDIAFEDGELTDQELNIIIDKSLDRLNLKLKLQGTAGEMSFNSSKGTIVPTPTSSLTALIVMQGECLITKRRQAQGSKSGRRVRQDGDFVDTTGGLSSQRDLTRTVCGELDRSIDDYLRCIDGAAEHGDIVWQGNRRAFEDADFDGDGFIEKDFRSPFDTKQNSRFHGHGHRH